MTRVEMRKIKEREDNQLRELMKFQNHFFKKFNNYLESVDDP
jgi:hypothetical protein